MHVFFIPAITIFFIVAVTAPPLLVFLYRWKEVPRRRADVEAMMKCAFDGPDKAACLEARQALDNNPYISDPKQTFDRYHSWRRYAVPWLMLMALTTVTSYVVYSWVIYQLSSAPTTGSSSAPSLLNTTSPAAATAATPPQNANSPTAGASGSNAAPTVPSSVAAAKDGPQKAPAGNTPNPQPEPLVARLSATIIMALAGGYIWSAFQICARRRSSELSPDDLYEIDLGLLAAVPIGIAFSLITLDANGLRTFVAFSASAFPLRDVQRLFRQYTTRKTLESSDAATAAARPAELHLGTTIEGLSDPTLVRLGELGISTVLDMAYCDPIKVMVQSGFSLPVIIDWIDQSLWALYAGELKTKIDKLGIRCSLDACEFTDLHLRDDSGKKKTTIDGSDKEALETLAQAMGSTPVLLQDLMFRIACDPQVVLLRKLWYPHGVPKELKAAAAGA